MGDVGVYEAMSTLRAVRRLRPDPVPDDVLRRVLEAASWAPTGGNAQPWRVIAVRDRAVALYDAGDPCGPEANMSKYLASEAAWDAANVAMDTFGGYGMAEEFGIERKFREARLYLVAPVANNLVLSFIAQHVLGLPRSF